MNTKFLICACSLVLAACTNIPVSDPNSPFSQIPVGSSLVLKHDIEVPADRFRAFLKQAENPPTGITEDERETVCILEMRNKQPSARTINPVEFRVTKATDDLYYTLRKPVQVAFNSTFSSNSRDTPSLESHVATIFIHSEKYPDVRSIRCEFDSYFSQGFPLSVATIRWAISGNFDLVINRKMP